MMKIEENSLFEKIIAKENLYLAAHQAALGKRFRDNVALWRLNIEEQVGRLHEDFKCKRYKHGSYKIFQIWDPKKREISVAPFRDRVVHHAFHDVIEPTVDKKFIYDSYACRNEKGTHQALGRADKFIRANRYCFHGDIKKYFPSIDHAILKGLLRRHIEDEDVLKVLDGVIDSSGELGLPIGNLTSQFFANLYLHELDFYVKHTLHCKYYIRYMDDFLVFDNDRIRLEGIRLNLGNFLCQHLKLQMHAGKSQITQSVKGVKFLGFRLYPEMRRMSTDGVRRFRKRLKSFRYLLQNGLMEESKAIESVNCWRSHSSYADTAILRKNIYNEVSRWNKNLAQAVVGDESKKKMFNGANRKKDDGADGQ